MATRQPRKKLPAFAETPAAAGPEVATDRAGGPDQPTGSQFTGRVIVLLKEKAAQKTLSDALGLRVARASDFAASAVRVEETGGADAILFDEIGACVMTLAPDQHNKLQGMADESSSIILANEPEQIMYAINAEYWRGYRDGVTSTIDRMIAGGPDQPAEQEDEPKTVQAMKQDRATWGLQLTKTIDSKFTGRGIRIAVLDTGLDLAHPDFKGRSIVSQSFIQGQAVQDGHGHGTHVIGTSCGTATPLVMPRYGVASDVQIFAGKVLSNQGSGADAGILAGINWAVANKVHVISMSLGAPTNVGDAFSPVYEGVAQRALAAGSLIVAAAGNESQRPMIIRPVGRPANCPSILSVAALDINLRVAPFSNRGLNPNGGQVDIAGPGVNVYSTWLMPRRYNTISGTSMATPHVAGIAALWAESQKISGYALWVKIVQSARRLQLPSADVGTGLVQAP